MENKNTKLLDAVDIENTPFKIVGNEENGYCIVLGINRVSKFHETQEDARGYFYNHMWEMIGVFTTLTVKGVVAEMKQEEEWPQFVKQKAEDTPAENEAF